MAFGLTGALQRAHPTDSRILTPSTGHGQPWTRLICSTSRWREGPVSEGVADHVQVVEDEAWVAVAAAHGRGGCPAVPRTRRAATAAPPARSAPASPRTSTPPDPPGRRAACPRPAAYGRTCGSVRPVVAGEALGAPHPHPVRRVVADAPEPRRVHERLGELQRMAVQRLPVRTSRRRLRDSARDAKLPIPDASGSTRKRVLFASRCLTPELHRPVPAQPAVPRRALERPRLPAHERQPVPAPLRDVAHATACELPEPQVVVLAHEVVPPTTLVRPRRTHRRLANPHVPFVERIRHARVVQHSARKKSVLIATSPQSARCV